MARDIADIRLDNALLLYTEFMRGRLGAAVDPRKAMLEAPFAKQLRISPSYWSQLKSRNRQIGETLARQFERLCGKAPGWLDTDQSRQAAPQPATPLDGDERFLVEMLLTCYRMNPQGVKQRLLELLEGELAKARRAGNVNRPTASAKFATKGH
jgi:hypothetical protein